MNQQAVAYTDEILDVLFQKYQLPADTPIVSSGMSMGGLGAILYSRFAKRAPVACVANCPVCDLPYHFTERADLPRTLYGAFWGESGTMAEVLQTHSPLHLIAQLPKINYHIFHCEKDLSVNIHRHSEKFVPAMQAQGHSITFDIVPEKGHCDLTEEANAMFERYCINEITGSY
jgi:acetyl esterase/lipase